MPGQFFSLLAETEEDQPSGSQLSDLFKKSSKKDAPAYDYSEVDNKKKRKQSVDDDSDNDDDVPNDDLSDLGDVDEEQEKVESDEKFSFL